MYKICFTGSWIGFYRILWFSCRSFSLWTKTRPPRISSSRCACSRSPPPWRTKSLTSDLTGRAGRAVEIQTRTLWAAGWRTLQVLRAAGIGRESHTHFWICRLLDFICFSAHLDVEKWASPLFFFWYSAFYFEDCIGKAAVDVCGFRKAPPPIFLLWAPPPKYKAGIQSFVRNEAWIRLNDRK